MSIGLHVVSFNRLMSFVVSAFTQTGLYKGPDNGGNPKAIMRILRDEAEMERIADGLHDIDMQYERATKKVSEELSAAFNTRRTAEKALMATINTGNGII